MPGPKGLPVVGTLFDYIKKDGYGFRKLFKVKPLMRKDMGCNYITKRLRYLANTKYIALDHHWLDTVCLLI